MDLPGERTQILIVCRIWTLNRQPVKSDEDSLPESILATENWLNWNCNLDNPNDSEDDCPADHQSDIEHNNGIEDPKPPEPQDVSAPPNVPWLVWPTRK